MPNIAALLKQEIARVARKEIRAEIEVLKKQLSAQRSQMAELRRELKAAQAGLRQQARRSAETAASPRRAGTQAKSAANERDGADAQRLRFSAKGMATNRQRLGLSAEDFGKLIGVTGQSVYAWEAGRSLPRARQLPAIAALRGVGKREVARRLAALESAGA